jgi:hypothetical protein
MDAWYARRVEKERRETDGQNGRKGGKKKKFATRPASRREYASYSRSLVLALIIRAQHILHTLAAPTSSTHYLHTFEAWLCRI